MTYETLTMIDTLGKDVRFAVQSFYTWKNFHNVAAADRSVFDGINRNAQTWNTVLAALQTTHLTVIGRLFDANSAALSVHSLLNWCIKHEAEFSREAWAARKISESGGTRPGWLDAQRIAEAFAPTNRDFELLSAAVRPHYLVYKEKIRPIRNKFTAHREIAALNSADIYFGAATLEEFENAFLCLHRVQRHLWEWFVNASDSPLETHRLAEPDYIRTDVLDLLQKVRYRRGSPRTV